MSNLLLSMDMGMFLILMGSVKHFNLCQCTIPQGTGMLMLASFREHLEIKKEISFFFLLSINDTIFCTGTTTSLLIIISQMIDYAFVERTRDLIMVLQNLCWL